MESFTMKIAGVAVEVQPLFQSTKEYCRAYLSDQMPEFTVTVTEKDLAHEQILLEQEAVEEGLKIRKFSDPFLERSVIQRRVADFLVGKGILMLHGSTVAVDGKAYLFTAPCGTGKTTHTRLWRQLLGERAVMVNDDKPFLEITPSGVLAYGSPWCGKHGLASNICVPLKGICSLGRGKENVIVRAEPKELTELLMAQVHTPETPGLQKITRDLVDMMEGIVPLWVMQCNKDLDAARVAYGAMHCE